MAMLAEETLSECDEVAATPFTVSLDSEGPYVVLYFFTD